MDSLAPPPLAATDALFVDFDGTLTPLQDDRNAVAIDPPMADALLAAAKRLGGVAAIISGRDLRDLSGRAPVGLIRIGAHGLESVAPDQAPEAAPPEAPAGLIEALEDLASHHSGVEVERKGPILAVHYRQNPEAQEAIERGVAAAAAEWDGYVSQPGKRVVEAKPSVANKGKAIRNWMSRPPFSTRRPVMAGDDATDEDAFKVVMELGGVAIKVGEGETCAPYRLQDVEAVRAWLGKAEA